MIIELKWKLTKKNENKFGLGSFDTWKNVMMIGRVNDENRWIDEKRKEKRSGVVVCNKKSKLKQNLQKIQDNSCSLILIYSSIFLSEL